MLKTNCLLIAILILLFSINGFSQSNTEEIIVKDGADIQAQITYGNFTDSRDTKHYKTVVIGKQKWMAENLSYLPAVSSYNSKSNTRSVYYVYGYNGTDVNAARLTDNYLVYGALYNWPAAQTACPAGWHIPSDDEWDVLIGYIGHASKAGISLKSADSIYWEKSKELKTNSSGFSALPGGSVDHINNWDNLGIKASFWGSDSRNATNMNTKSLSDYTSWVTGTYSNISAGLSIRCLKN